MAKKKLKDKLVELESISNEFNNIEDLDLEEAVFKYEKAANLLKEIKSELNTLEVKVREIKASYEEE